MADDPRTGDGRLRYDAASQRRALIVAQLRRAGHVSVSGLSEALAVSEMTVRRDLRRLVQAGDATLVHGGASLPPTSSANPAFLARAALNSEAKRLVGRAAAAMVALDDTVAIDAGTTALEVATSLPDDFDGCVITHSVPVLTAMLSRPLVRVVAIGGELSQDNQAMIGPRASGSVRDLRIPTLFLGATRVDGRGIYVRSELELDVKHALLDVAEHVVLVLDASKEQSVGTVLVCGLDRVDTVVTDRPPSPALAAHLRSAGTKVRLA